MNQDDGSASPLPGASPEGSDARHGQAEHRLLTVVTAIGEWVSDTHSAPVALIAELELLMKHDFLKPLFAEEPALAEHGQRILETFRKCGYRGAAEPFPPPNIPT